MNHQMQIKTLVSIVGIGLVSTYSPSSRAVNLNYERLSSLEQPLAVEYQDVTFSLTGLADAGWLRLEQQEGSDSNLLANFQINAETQLPNSLTLGAAYFGQHNNRLDDSYTDNVALYLGGVWGTLSVGNVTGLITEQTRRQRGTGNAELSFDSSLATLADYGITYIGRYGPMQLLAAVDEDSNIEIGSTYQRPIGNKDYRFSLRYRDTEFQPSSPLYSLSSKSLNVVGELTYGSMVLDIGIGTEQMQNESIEADRNYASFGARTKIGRVTLSGEAHLGEFEGEDEQSYALGLKADIARGLSLNLGVNHSEVSAAVEAFELLQTDATEGSISLRYSF